MENFLHHYDRMPIPPVPEHMEMFHAGDVSIGVEFRVLTEEMLSAVMKRAQRPGQPDQIDAGVSLHVFVKASDGDLERLRFDCFDEGPHYHYIGWSKNVNDAIFIDPVAVGDPLIWSLNCLRSRLALMLENTGVDDATQRVDPKRVEAILPLVTEAAYRARYRTDKRVVTLRSNAFHRQQS